MNRKRPLSEYSASGKYRFLRKFKTNMARNDESSSNNDSSNESGNLFMPFL